MVAGGGEGHAAVRAVGRAGRAADPVLARFGVAGVRRGRTAAAACGFAGRADYSRDASRQPAGVSVLPHHGPGRLKGHRADRARLENHRVHHAQRRAVVRNSRLGQWPSRHLHLSAGRGGARPALPRDRIRHRLRRPIRLRRPGPQPALEKIRPQHVPLHARQLHGLPRPRAQPMAQRRDPDDRADVLRVRPPGRCAESQDVSRVHRLADAGGHSLGRRADGPVARHVPRARGDFARDDRGTVGVLWNTGDSETAAYAFPHVRDYLLHHWQVDPVELALHRGHEKWNGVPARRTGTTGAAIRTGG